MSGRKRHTPAKRVPASAGAASFMLLVYRIPPSATAARVAVWRQLNKIGVVYLQQMAVVFPADADLRHELQSALKKIVGARGEYHLFPLGSLPADEREKLVARFRDQASRHYKEIIENCEVNFVKEIEFETYRKNFTYEEAEEIRTEFEKIVAWFDRVKARDWFAAPNRALARTWLSRCERLLERFENRVYATSLDATVPRTGPIARRRASHGPSLGPNRGRHGTPQADGSGRTRRTGNSLPQETPHNGRVGTPERRRQPANQPAAR